MRVAILDDVHHAYEGTPGITRLRERADVIIFTQPVHDLSSLRGIDAFIANRENAVFTHRAGTAY
jgi:hypothetical protein